MNPSLANAAVLMCKDEQMAALQCESAAVS